MAGGIAHDFNNILAPIIGMSELLLLDLPSGTETYRNAGSILVAGTRARDLVKQILAFSRRGDHASAPTRLQHLLEDVLDLGRATIPSYIRIIHDISSDCSPVKIDATQFHQVAMNVITNAYHAAEFDGGKVTVRLENVRLEAMDMTSGRIEAGRYVRLSVTDNGPGIPAELMEKIFDPYVTTKERGKGTGLGLAVVYGIVKECRGEIDVTCREGEGTIFDIYFPAYDGEIEPPASEDPATPVAGVERILLIDDEPAVLRVESQLMARQGYVITAHSSSAEALEVFRAEPDSFDMVISDMNMPEMAGDRLAGALKRIRPDIPIIVCSGFSDRMDEARAASTGIDAFLMKPIAQADLLRTVRRVLDKRKSRR